MDERVCMNTYFEDDVSAGSGRDAKHIAQLAVQTHGDNNNTQVLPSPTAKLTISKANYFSQR